VPATHHRVAIIGSGFAGLCMAIRLSQRGEQDYVVLEKASDLGGTWRDNRYPGCACDVPSRLYSFSFEQKPDWSRDYASSEEIWDYLRTCADRYAVSHRIAYGADLREAHYDEAARRWRLRAADGRAWTADALVLGVGALHQPSTPDIPGIDDFAGPVMHTAEWPENDGLDGKRVAVIGTGASAVQLVPELARRVSALTVFQRTAPWIIPKADKPWSQSRRRLFARSLLAQRAVRWATYWQLESRVVGLARWPKMMRVFEAYSRRHLRRSVKDPELREKLTPQHTMGCKRILLSNDYWPTFERPHARLETSPIARIEPGALVTADGARHEADALVLGTGFNVMGSFERIDLRGLDGLSLREAWDQGLRSNLGITMAGFPELYLLLGPNTGLGHNSVILMIEFATTYILQCLRRGAKRPHVLTAAAQERFTAAIREKSAGTVWSSGCRSWYLDRQGNNATIWPGSTVSYWWRTRRVDPTHFQPVAPPPR
jgi:cation diffusion facilitator CzcD-associated flavoprotein CzcO